MASNTYEREHLVVTAVGPDRVGLVEQISNFLLKEGCNIEDSKMAVFCGEFTIILLVTGKEDALGRVAASIPSLTAQTGLTFTCKHPAARASAEEGIRQGMEDVRKGRRRPARRGRATCTTCRGARTTRTARRRR